MQVLETIKEFFSHENDVAAVYLYGRYAAEQSLPDTDIEIALLFPSRMDEDAIGEYTEQLSSRSPMGDHPGILMPFALNTHILPVIYEILHGGTLLVENDALARKGFQHEAEIRIDEERPALLEQAKEAILQARNLGMALIATDGYMLPQPPRYLDAIRVGWRLARVLGSVAILEQSTREQGREKERGERDARDAERLGQVIGWHSNAVGAVTGIAKAMLNMFEMARPARRWEVFLPLADAGLMTMELALQLAAAVELRWSLLAGGVMSWDRVSSGVRAGLAPTVAFARLAAWYTELPGGRSDQKVH